MEKSGWFSNALLRPGHQMRWGCDAGQMLLTAVNSINRQRWRFGKGGGRAEALVLKSKLRFGGNIGGQ